MNSRADWVISIFAFSALVLLCNCIRALSTTPKTASRTSMLIINSTRENPLLDGFVFALGIFMFVLALQGHEQSSLSAPGSYAADRPQVYGESIVQSTQARAVELPRGDGKQTCIRVYDHYIPANIVSALHITARGGAGHVGHGVIGDLCRQLVDIS